jgi:hypothetical protein
MLSLVEPAQTSRFIAGPAWSPAAGSPDRPTGVIDSVSYQALLSRLGLSPDPRLCVPAVER